VERVLWVISYLNTLIKACNNTCILVVMSNKVLSHESSPLIHFICYFFVSHRICGIREGNLNKITTNNIRGLLVCSTASNEKLISGTFYSEI
jgi:hypothetical protein